MILVICGPTASGKSALALNIAEMFDGEIINGDAFQIYQEFDIGTAKPTVEERKRVPHHLFDFVSPTDSFSPKEYQELARKTIEDIKKRGKLPIIVGGSGNYQKATLFDYHFEEYEEPDLSFYDGMTEDELYKELIKIDPLSATKIHPHNRKRVLRALALYHATGRRKSEIEEEQEHTMIYDAQMVGIDLPRDVLYDRINQRVLTMIEAGLEEEVTRLYHLYGENIQPFQAIGYKEWIPYLKKEITREEVILEIQKHSRNYAKRQMTFFKNQFPIAWYESVESAKEALIRLCKGENENGEN